jgi:hypothetical protein
LPDDTGTEANNEEASMFCAPDAPVTPFRSTALRDEPAVPVTQPPAPAPRPYDPVGDFLLIGNFAIEDRGAYAALKRLDGELLALRTLAATVRDLMPSDGACAYLSEQIANHERVVGGLPSPFTVDA